MNNFTLCHGSIREGLRGPSGAYFEDPAAALDEAIRALEVVPWAIVGAAESTWHPVARFERPGEAPWEGAVGACRAPLTVPDAWRARGWHRDRRLVLTVAAAVEAWSAAGRPDGLALSLAVGLEQAFLDDLLALVTPEGLDWTRDPGGPAVRYRTRLDLPAVALAELLPVDRTVVHASACAGGTLALIQAAQWIEDGVARVLCGGGDSMLNPLGLAGLHKLGVPTLRGACRPFDARRDGILVGEGAACFVVEEEQAARARGAPILARIRGWGSSQDGYAPTAPDPSGRAIRDAMRAALATVDPSEVGHVNAHGTGTPLNDAVEAKVLAELVPRASVASFKGALGHTMAAAGALESAGVILALGGGVMPGTRGFEVADPECPVEVGGPRRLNGRFVLKNSFGFGGQNASVLFERP